MADSRYAGEAGLQAVFGQIKAAMAEKQDKINDMGLSHNDYSNAEKQKNAQNASDIVSLNNDIDDIIEKMDGDATTYPYADVITIEDAVPANLADCTVKIEPDQDLHGYDKPWVGGAGKNKLPPPLTVTKTPGSAVTVTNKDGYLTFNGAVASGEKVTVTFDNTVVPSDAQIVIMNSSALATANISFHNGNTQYDYFTFSTANRVLNTSSLNLLIGKTINKYDINFMANATLNDFTIGLMLLHTGSDNTTFEPYSNICPITQYDSCKITRDGKNLCDFVDKTRDSSGYYIGSAQQAEYIDSNHSVLKAGRYTFSCKYKNITNGTAAQMLFYNKTGDIVPGKTFQNLPSSGTLTYTFDVSDSLGTVRLYCNSPSGGTFYDFQLELGSIATSYESYNGNGYHIELNGNTYYGQLRIDTKGNVYFDIDRVLKEYDGSEDEYWIYEAATGGKNFYISIPDAVASQNLSTGLLCNQALGCITYVTQRDRVWISVFKNFNVTFGDTLGISTVSDWKAYLSSNPIQVLYRLATPFTVQLTPQQIQLLKGYNIIYADTGDVEVTVNNTMDAIGSVQEQVNELDSGLTEFGSYTTVETLVGKWNGANLYRKLIQIQSLPNNGSITIQTGTICQVVMLTGYAEQNGYTITIPYTAISGGIVIARLQSYGTELIIATTADFSAYKGYVVIYYTR